MTEASHSSGSPAALNASYSVRKIEETRLSHHHRIRQRFRSSESRNSLKRYWFFEVSSLSWTVGTASPSLEFSTSH